ncbi:hypothetical protein [Owenweeksia hongkongensis]|uniref:hypothetical protein n=1 Tax=Owenweeksia hongkongensis TaxID=253245 RepID=UPI003A914751
MLKALIYVFLCVTPVIARAQLNFCNEERQDTIQDNDSIRVTCVSKEVYNYFEQRNTDIFAVGRRIVIPIEQVFIDTNYLFTRKVTLSKETDAGKLRIFYKERLVQSFEVRNNMINGQGIVYSWKEGKPVIFAMFKSNKLDGVAVIADLDGSLNEVVYFEKGIYQKHLYHKRALTQEGLDYLTEGKSNPFDFSGVIVR